MIFQRAGKNKNKQNKQPPPLKNNKIEPSRLQCSVQSSRAGRWDFMTGDNESGHWITPPFPKNKRALLHYTQHTRQVILWFPMRADTLGSAWLGSTRIRAGQKKKKNSNFSTRFVSGRMSVLIDGESLESGWVESPGKCHLCETEILGRFIEKKIQKRKSALIPSRRAPTPAR